MSTDAKALPALASGRMSRTVPRPSPGPPATPLAEFEAIYPANVEVVMRYFARRCADPQAVADLTSETFVRAATGFGSFDPARGSARGWIFGIAGHVFARHCAGAAGSRDAVARPADGARWSATRSRS